MNEEPLAADQRRYARLLAIVTNTGLALLIALFASYAFGLVEPHTPAAHLPDLWHMSAKDLLAHRGMPQGWGWTQWIHRADILTLAGIAFLAFASVPCLAAILPLYVKGRQRALAAICGAEILVIVLAASGLVAVGH